MNNFVLQDWLSDLSFKQQTVLICALRGCDGVDRNHPSKICVRYLRATVLKNAATSNCKFMNGGSLDFDMENIEKFRNNMDECPVHFVLHFIHAAEIIGYFHPNAKISEFWQRTYALFVDAMHLRGETAEECEYRLRDGVDSE